MEIGSYFIIEETIGEYNDTLEFYLNQFAQHKIYFDSGRSAIRFVCGLSSKKTVLLPDYLCDSMIQPFVEENFKIDFYKIDDNLEPIIKSIKAGENYGIFVHLGYFGNKSSDKLYDTIRVFKSLETLVIEDITHSLFSKTKLSTNSDYYVCSIRKWLGVPDGGILLSNHQIQLQLNFFNSELLEYYNKGSKLKKNKDTIKTFNESYLEHFAKAEETLNQSNVIYSISSLSKDILHRYDFKKMVSIRQENAAYLSHELNELGLKTLQFDFDLFTPLFIPIFFANSIERDYYKSHLIKSGIYTPIHWRKPIHKDINNELYDLELSIPCDQRYTLEDMKKIITEIKKIMEIRND